MKVLVALIALVGCFVFAQNAQVMPAGNQGNQGNQGGYMGTQGNMGNQGGWGNQGNQGMMGNRCSGRNEQFKQCGTACEPTCTNQNPMCTKQCVNNVCQCSSGYVRDSMTRQCVRPNQCRNTSSPAPSQSPQRCGANESFRTCGSACEPTCQNPNPQACTMQCISNVCQCNQGFVRGPSGCIRQQACRN